MTKESSAFCIKVNNLANSKFSMDTEFQFNGPDRAQLRADVRDFVKLIARSERIDLAQFNVEEYRYGTFHHENGSVTYDDHRDHVRTVYGNDETGSPITSIPLAQWVSEYDRATSGTVDLVFPKEAK